MGLALRNFLEKVSGRYFLLMRMTGNIKRTMLALGSASDQSVQLLMEGLFVSLLVSFILG